MKLSKILVSGLLLLVLALPVQAEITAAESIKGLESTNPEVRIESIYAISKGYDISMVPHLIKALEMLKDKAQTLPDRKHGLMPV